MTRQDAQHLLALCEAADDQDTGTLDAFRGAATVGVVAELCRAWLAAPSKASIFDAGYEAGYAVAMEDKHEARMQAMEP